MAIITTDIDIDFIDRNMALEGLRYVHATVVHPQGKRTRHASGVYLQDAPIDPVSGLCAFDYEVANQLGYFKIDFLNLAIYEGVRDEDHLIALLAKEPDWEVFNYPELVSQLAQIADHFGIVQAIAPKSIEDLAVVLALRLSSKRYLLGKPRAVIDAEVWKGGEGFAFKRAHAIAYAAAIVVQVNLMCEKAAEEMTVGDNPLNVA